MVVEEQADSTDSIEVGLDNAAGVGRRTRGTEGRAGRKEYLFAYGNNAQ